MTSKNYCYDIKAKFHIHKTNGVIPYKNAATIDWFIGFSGIRLKKAKYDNPPNHVDTSLENVIPNHFIMHTAFN